MDNCNEKTVTSSIREMKTYILQFIYKDGNGWAFVNATSPKQAQLVFTNQTRYYGAKVIAIKETKYYGDNIQLVFEGAVTTIPTYAGDGSMIVNFNILDYVPDGDKYEDFAEYLAATISNIISSKGVNLTDYEMKKDLLNDVSKILNDLGITSEPGTGNAVIPEIGNNGNWFVNGEDTGKPSRGPQGIQGLQGPPGSQGPQGIPGISTNIIVTVNNSNSIVTKAIDSDTFYKFSNPLSGLYLTLNPVDSGKLAVYYGKFIAGSNMQFTVNDINSYPNGVNSSFEEGETYEFYIVDGIISFSKIDTSGDHVSTAYPIVTLSVGRGSFVTAKNHANAHPDAYFQWFLKQSDGQGNTIQKMIWHIPADPSITGDTDKFIDALGSIIDFS